jgi:hypothetical protein
MPEYFAPSVAGPGSVRSGAIASGVIYRTPLADNAITSAHLTSGQVGAAVIANNSILSGHLTSEVIGGGHLNPDDVWPGRIYSGAISFSSGLTVGAGEGNTVRHLSLDGLVRIQGGPTPYNGAIFDVYGVDYPIQRGGAEIQIINGPGMTSGNFMIQNMNSFTLTTNPLLNVDASGRVQMYGDVGFFNSPPAVKQNGFANPTDLNSCISSLVALRTALINYGLLTSG